jgi:hypothetical protein
MERRLHRHVAEGLAMYDWVAMDVDTRHRERRSWALHIAESVGLLLGPPLIAVAIMVYGLYRSYETTPWGPDGERVHHGQQHAATP